MKIFVLRLVAILALGLFHIEEAHAFRPVVGAGEQPDSDEVTITDPRTHGVILPRLTGALAALNIHMNGRSVHWMGMVGDAGAIQLWGNAVMAWPKEASLQQMDVVLRKFVDENYDTLKVHSTDLRYEKDRTRYSGDYRYITYTRYLSVEGHAYPVEGSFVTFRFKKDRLIEITNTSFGDIGPVEAPMISDTEAYNSVAQDSGFDDTKDRVISAVQPTLQPFYDARGKIHFRFVYNMSIRKSFPQGAWKYSVNASDGRIVRLMNGLHTSGQVTGELYQRLPTTTVRLPFGEVLVQSGTNKELTAADGTFQEDAGGAHAELTGARASVRQSGKDKVSEPAGQNGVINFPASSHLSENMAYFHASRVNNFVHQFIKSIPTANGKSKPFDFLNTPIVINTNAATAEMKSCNAWFDEQTKQLNFLEEDAKCKASSHFADIIYHEWGHSLDDALGGIQDSAFSEGIGDFTAVLMTNDPHLAPGFIKGKPGPLRDISQLKVYPKDRSQDPHAESLIVSGAWYDVLQMMKAAHGEQAGRLKTAELFFKHLISTDSYMDSYMGALVVDDDDANLDNCTPHMCIFNAAFAKHGLTTVDARCTGSQVSALPACADSTIMPR